MDEEEAAKIMSLESDSPERRARASMRLSGIENEGDSVPDGDNYMTESAMEIPEGALGIIDDPIPDNADSEPNPIEPAFTPAEMDEILGNDPDSAHQDLLCPHCQEIGVDPASGEDVSVVKKFVRIDPDSKWILTLPDDASYEDATRFADRVHDWWNNEEGSDFPIMVIGGEAGMDIRLVRVDKVEVGPELVNCGVEPCIGHIVGDGEKCLTSEDRYGG